MRIDHTTDKSATYTKCCREHNVTNNHPWWDGNTSNLILGFLSAVFYFIYLFIYFNIFVIFLFKCWCQMSSKNWCCLDNMIGFIFVYLLFVLASGILLNRYRFSFLKVYSSNFFFSILLRLTVTITLAILSSGLQFACTLSGSVRLNI